LQEGVVSAVAAPLRGYQLGLVGEHHRREGLDLERHRRERTHCSDGGRLTLEQRLDGVWEGLHAAGVAACPMCGSRMTASGDGGGHCGGCGTTLS
jgi:ribosomal protein L37AE/L43A